MSGRTSICSATPLRANIAFGKAGATESEIVAAAKAACAHEFIMGFPLGYDTPVGEHGTQLSGGQRQRDRRRARAESRMRRSSCSMKPPQRWIRNPNSRCRKRSSISARTAPRSSLPIACTPSCTPTPYSWSRAARSSSAAGTMICCAAAGAMPRSSASSIAMPGRHAGADQRKRVRPIEQSNFRLQPAESHHERHVLCHSRFSASLASGRRRHQILSGSAHLVRRAQLSRTHPRDGE